MRRIFSGSSAGPSGTRVDNYLKTQRSIGNGENYTTTKIRFFEKFCSGGLVIVLAIVVFGIGFVLFRNLEYLLWDLLGFNAIEHETFFKIYFLVESIAGFGFGVVLLSRQNSLGVTGWMKRILDIVRRILFPCLLIGVGLSGLHQFMLLIVVDRFIQNWR